MIKRALNKNSTLIRAVSYVLAAVLFASSLFVGVLGTLNSTAFLYDEHDVSVSYSVAQLSFDLSSNHMYSYYNTDSSFSYNTAFASMLTSLDTSLTDFENDYISLASLNSAVQAQFTAYYSGEFVQALQLAWENRTSQSNYDELTRTIYNNYYTKYPYLFKIKSFQIESVEDDKSIWYYYAKDLVSTYYGEYIVQENTTGTKQSSVRIGVKLKGGTTFSEYTLGSYYDAYFNDMVNGFTLNFVNTGNVGLYMNFLLDMNTGVNQDNGVLGMVLPYGTTLATLQANPTYYNSTSGEYDYRAIISDYLENRGDFYTSSISDVLCDDPGNAYRTLKYASLRSLLNEWNAYAVGTYQVNSDLNEIGNFSVAPYDDEHTGVIKNVSASLLFWSDYEKNRATYNGATAGEWATDEEYAMYSSYFTVELRTSLKNSDMSMYDSDEWGQLYNRREEYEKYAAVSNFDIDGYAYFQKELGDGTYQITNAKEHMEGGYIICSYSDVTAVNYIGNLHFNIRYSGFSPAYMRVRLIEQFTNTRDEIEAVNKIEFNLADGWYDNRSSDLYLYSDKLYYSSENATLTTSGKAKYITVPVINGLDSSITEPGDIDILLNKDTTMKLKITFFAEAVQPNRIEEYWKVSEEDIAAICN